jgi:riboflavin synthase
MFTGIIEEIGQVKEVIKLKDHCQLAISCQGIYKDLKIGESVSVNGVCLTVTKSNKNVLVFDVVNETLARTNLQYLKKDSFLNLERALRAQDRFNGHFVTGHIDCTVKISNISLSGNCYIEVEIPGLLREYIVEKGSVAIEGISLTIGKITANGLIVYLIPHTIKSTNLQFKKKNDSLNLECDILAKYIRNPSLKTATNRITPLFLKEHGFI